MTWSPTSTAASSLIGATTNLPAPVNLSTFPSTTRTPSLDSDILSCPGVATCVSVSVILCSSAGLSVSVTIDMLQSPLPRYYNPAYFMWPKVSSECICNSGRRGRQGRSGGRSKGHFGSGCALKARVWSHVGPDHVDDDPVAPAVVSERVKLGRMPPGDPKVVRYHRRPNRELPEELGLEPRVL